MSSFLKMLLLITAFEDKHSQWMVFWEWYNSDPILDICFDMAIRMADI